MIPLESRLAALQSLGFLKGWSLERCQQELQRQWDSDSVEEAMILALDRSRVWHQDLKFNQNPLPLYREMLQSWATLSQGAFQPQNIGGADPLQFEVPPYRIQFHPAPGHYLDTPGLAQLVNAHLFGDPRFEVSDALGMPNLVVFLDSPTRRTLEQRGWSFSPQPQVWGFLSTFWEQGMEEMPWRIFQHRSHCAGLEGDWDRAGIHRLGEGDRLEVVAPDGSLLWQGVLQAKRRGWFGKQQVIHPDWHPPDVPAATWQSWFGQHPPLRARLAPRAG